VKQFRIIQPRDADLAICVAPARRCSLGVLRSILCRCLTRHFHRSRANDGGVGGRAAVRSEDFNIDKRDRLALVNLRAECPCGVSGGDAIFHLHAWAVTSSRRHRDRQVGIAAWMIRNASPIARWCLLRRR